MPFVKRNKKAVEIMNTVHLKKFKIVPKMSLRIVKIILKIGMHKVFKPNYFQIYKKYIYLVFIH